MSLFIIQQIRRMPIFGQDDSVTDILSYTYAR